MYIMYICIYTYAHAYFFVSPRAFLACKGFWCISLEKEGVKLVSSALANLLLGMGFPKTYCGAC